MNKTNNTPLSDEAFKKIGYVIDRQDWFIEYFREYGKKTIFIDIYSKTFSCSRVLNKKEIKALCLLFKELGWADI